MNHATEAKYLVSQVASYSLCETECIFSHRLHCYVLFTYGLLCLCSACTCDHNKLKLPTYSRMCSPSPRSYTLFRLSADRRPGPARGVVPPWGRQASQTSLLPFVMRNTATDMHTCLPACVLTHYYTTAIRSLCCVIVTYILVNIASTQSQLGIAFVNENCVHRPRLCSECAQMHADDARGIQQRVPDRRKTADGDMSAMITELTPIIPSVTPCR